MPDYEALQRSRDRLITMVGVLVFAVAALAALVVFLIFEVDDTTSSTNDFARRLEECTTPSEPGDPHECFEAGQARTGEAVDTIIRANLYLHQCMRAGALDLEACVRQKLEQDDG